MHNIKTTGPTPIATGFKNLKTIATVTDQLSREELNVCDVALGAYVDVMHPKFYAWYCKAWYQIGERRFHDLASIARADGKQPGRLFSSLIKKELSLKQGGPAGGAPTGPTTNFNPNRKVA